MINYAEGEKMKRSLGIYIHIPFCLAKCRYCDFCSFDDLGDGAMRQYKDELCRRIAGLAEYTAGYSVDTLYFGGGTPSLLSAAQLSDILNALHRALPFSDNAEITLECNPATASMEKLSDFRALGVNRLSIGLQSAVDYELALLGRAHSVSDFVSCYNDARSVGFDNISADLMYGIPEQSLESFRYSVSFLCDLDPEHISSYGLMIEEGTDFYRNRDKLNVADDDMQAELYILLGELLAKRGYNKYEISNFSRCGYESRHNMRYWLGKEYIGLGVAAHSYFGDERYGNSRNIGAFLNGEDIVCEREKIEGDALKFEYVMLRLRLAEGIDREDYRARFGEDFDRQFNLSSYIKNGFMQEKGSRVFFTDKGFLVSNRVLAEILT